MMETNLLIWTGAKLRKVWVWVALRRTILMYGYDARELSTSQTQGTAVWRQAATLPRVRQDMDCTPASAWPKAAPIASEVADAIAGSRCPDKSSGEQLRLLALVPAEALSERLAATGQQTTRSTRARWRADTDC